MIYNIQTFCTYGYWPEDLNDGSTKLIVVACDECEEVRYIRKRDYSSLCKSCSLLKYYKDPLTHEKKSKEQLKRFEDNPVSDKTKEKSSISARKRYKDNPMPNETKEKLSEATSKHFSKMDDPGQDIIKHHIAYDFKRPKSLTVEVTRSFHGSIHHPKGTKMGERGYGLID